MMKWSAGTPSSCSMQAIMHILNSMGYNRGSCTPITKPIYTILGDRGPYCLSPNISASKAIAISSATSVPSAPGKSNWSITSLYSTIVSPITPNGSTPPTMTHCSTVCSNWPPTTAAGTSLRYCTSTIGSMATTMMRHLTDCSTGTERILMRYWHVSHWFH